MASYSEQSVVKKDDKNFPELDARLVSKNGKSTLQQIMVGI